VRIVTIETSSTVFVSESSDPDSFPFLVHRRAPMASTTAFKDRNLIAVIGDEVRLLLLVNIAQNQIRVGRTR
jgi:hypothetical protein